MKNRILTAVVAVVTLVALGSCSKAPLGTKSNPLKLWFMPLKDEAVFKANAPAIEEYLEKQTGYAVDVKLADSFLDIVKAFGKKKADLAFMNTLGYLLTHDWSGTDALLQYTYGDLYRTYRGEIVARVGAGIDEPKDLNGKSFAFVSPYSAGGYLYALKYLEDNHIKPSKTEFADGHLKGLEMVYRGDVDAAATYHERPTSSGLTKDARVELEKKYPDILSVVKIVALTDEIPNGPVAVRKGISEETRAKIKDALTAYAKTPEGRTTLMTLYNITGLVPAPDGVYEPVGKVITQVGKTIQDMVPGGEPYFKTWIVPGLE